jgi:ABC-type nickel/cobalt efflux system permease component RcnA
MSDAATTQTSREPSPDGLARATDGHDPEHPGDIAGEAHGADDHGEDHGHDDHAHDSDALGPVDVQAWGALILGVAAGLLIVLCLVLTTSILA